MTTQTKALKLALEALETPRPFDSYPPLWRAYEKTINKAIDDIKEALAEPEQDSTYTYASSLATAIWQKHYIKESPKFALLDTTEGVLTQIDNMTCGLVREKPAQPEPDPVAWEQFYPDIGKPQIAINSETVGYVAPQRTWVGLTEEEIEKGRAHTFSINNPYCPCDSKTMRKAVRWAEAKLKKKNTRGKE